MQKENQANLALAFSVLGAIGTAGQGNSFLLTTVHHGFLAATIGGLADWFAVKAIFGRPLGISHRTDILRRNRTRIMDALVSFSSDDLLSRDNIMQVVEREQIGTLLMEYLEHRGGRERLVNAAVEILGHIASDVDSRHIARELTPYIVRALHDLPLEDSFVEFLSVLAEYPHAERIFNLLIRMGHRILQTQAFQELLRENIASIRTEYERDGMIRAFVLSFFDDETIASWFTTRADEILQTALDPENRRHIDGVEAFGAFISGISADSSLRDILYHYKIRLVQNIDLEAIIANFIDTRIQGNHPFWLPYVKELLNDKVDRFVHSAAWQSRADRWVKDLISAEIEKHHELVAVFVRDYLNQKSDDELIAFLERKIRTDLQMIRINGAVVGAIVGIGLSLLVTLAERMWGL
ncbi:DUF445 domain-containing protein [Selenomonas sp. F0473]|uniref:DUF445 domain-containing protein n=1 Tax=Selenomonas sp. F0473 TaxID=999423 RepID=UPI00029E5BEC|nr:DUF445 domain-containing protein [Selenomonas sp. F0473]EKU71674.1 hypothetical protein HMPREF9161_00359 [Selenomonas sp. F0473]